MYTDGQIYMGLADGQRVNMPLNMSNRHGLIAGASGTGKTITMKAMAESFSDAGVPVFLCCEGGCLRNCHSRCGFGIHGQED